MNIEKVLGLCVTVQKSLPALRFDELKMSVKPDVAEFMQEVNQIRSFNLRDYYVYFHRLEFSASETIFKKRRKIRFINDIPLQERIGSLVIGYYINQKQKSNMGVRFCNHWYKQQFDPHDLFATPIRSRYFLEGTAILSDYFSPHILVSLVRHTVPLRHRKIKLRVMARISESALARLPEKYHKRIVSEFDVKLERRTENIGLV